MCHCVSVLSVDRLISLSLCQATRQRGVPIGGLVRRRRDDAKVAGQNGKHRGGIAGVERVLQDAAPPLILPLVEHSWQRAQAAEAERLADVQKTETESEPETEIETRKEKETGDGRRELEQRRLYEESELLCKRADYFMRRSRRWKLEADRLCPFVGSQEAINEAIWNKSAMSRRRNKISSGDGSER